MLRSYKSPLLSILFLIFCVTSVSAQVSIGTSTPDDGSALEVESTTGTFVPPRMTAAQMNAIPTPLMGSVIYNTTVNKLYVYDNQGWESSEGASVILNRSGGTMNAADNTYVNFPLNAGNTLYIDTDSFEIVSNGKIRIKKTGTYLLSGSFSTSNLPSGNRKYIIGAFINTNTLIGYLSRGYATISSGTDYFGTSGVLAYYFVANQVVDFKYVLNNGGNSVSNAFFNIAINKI